MASLPVTAPAAHRFTRDEYRRMGEAGLFQDERVELLDGEVVTMSAKLGPHAFAVHQLNRLLMSRLDSCAVVRIQDPIVLDDWGEPEPDVAICALVPDRYRRAHPRADQVLLVIEVAESSLGYDRTRKARAYAAAGIPTYWIVNLVDGEVEVLTDPDPAAGEYGRRCVVPRGGTLGLPDGSVLAVDDVLP